MKSKKDVVGGYLLVIIALISNLSQELLKAILLHFKFTGGVEQRNAFEI